MKKLLGLALIAAACVGATLTIAFAQSPPIAPSDVAALVRSPAIKAAVAACGADRQRLCSSVLPGGGRIVRCLAANADGLSPQCRSAMIEARDAVLVKKGGVPSGPAK